MADSDVLVSTHEGRITLQYLACLLFALNLAPASYSIYPKLQARRLPWTTLQRCHPSLCAKHAKQAKQGKQGKQGKRAKRTKLKKEAMQMLEQIEKSEYVAEQAEQAEQGKRAKRAKQTKQVEKAKPMQKQIEASELAEQNTKSATRATSHESRRIGRGLGSAGRLPPQRKHVPTKIDFEGAIARVKQRTSALEGKDVDEQFTEVGQCIHLKSAVTDVSDMRLFGALEKEIEKTGNALRLHRAKTHREIFGDDLAGSTIFAAIVTNMLALFDLTLVDCWVNVYRDGGNQMRFHHDNYQWNSPRPTVTIGLSLGETRDLVFINTITNETFTVPQQNGDIFAFDEPFNNLYKHAVPPIRQGASRGSRISVIIWANEDLAIGRMRRLAHRESKTSRKDNDWGKWPTMGQGELSREARKRRGKDIVTSEKLKGLLQALIREDLDDIVMTYE